MRPASRVVAHRAIGPRWQWALAWLPLIMLGPEAQAHRAAQSLGRGQRIAIFPPEIWVGPKLDASEERRDHSRPEVRTSNKAYTDARDGACGRGGTLVLKSGVWGWESNLI